MRYANRWRGFRTNNSNVCVCVCLCVCVILSVRVVAFPTPLLASIITVVLQPPYYVSPYKQSLNIVCFTTNKMHSIEDCCSVSCMYTVYMRFLFCLFCGVCVCVCVPHLLALKLRLLFEVIHLQNPYNPLLSTISSKW